MALDIIGAGFGRTGTNSLKWALEELGFAPCHHMVEVIGNPAQVALWAAAARGEAADWDRVFAGYRAQVDWPGAHYWRELAARYPEAKVILSLRSPESWHKSVMSTIYPALVEGLTHEDEGRRLHAEMAYEIIVQQQFDGRLDDPEHAMAVFRRHNEAVKKEIPPERLLVFEAKDGWAPLCRFLGVPEPTTPYPSRNSSQAFSDLLEDTFAKGGEGQG